MKVVRNDCCGGFGLSEKAIKRMEEITGDLVDETDYEFNNALRSAPELIQVVEELGEEASYQYSRLIVVEVPDDVEWTIEDYDGWEIVEEVHRTW